MFNHTSERQARHFFIPTVVEKGFQIKTGREKAFTLGNLSTYREYLDARDVAEAYKLEVTKPLVHGEPYNIASGTGYSGLFVVKLVAKMLGLEKYGIQQSNLRKVDNPFVIGNGKKFSQLTGWNRRIFIEKTIESMIKSIDPGFEPDATTMRHFIEENKSLFVQKEFRE